MSKFLTQIQLKAGITTTFESATPEEVLDTLVALTSPGEAARAATPAQAVPAAELAPVAPPAVISRGNLSMEIGDPYGAGTTTPPADPKSPMIEGVGKETHAKKPRTDQKKGAAKVAAVLERPDVVPLAEPAQAAAPADVPAPAAPKPVSSAGKSDTYEKVVTAVRNFARNKGIPAATKLVAEFKTAKGEAAARLDRVQAEDYAAMLARIDALSV